MFSGMLLLVCKRVFRCVRQVEPFSVPEFNLVCQVSAQQTDNSPVRAGSW